MPLKILGLRLVIMAAIGAIFLLHRTPAETKKPPFTISFKQNIAAIAEEGEEEHEEEFTRERMLHEFKMLRNPITGVIPADFHKRELEAAKKIPDRNPIFAPWLSGISGTASMNNQNTYQSIGPDNIAGRSRTLAFDKRDSNIMLTGGPTGGIFRSTDGGADWTFVTPENDIRSANTIVQDPVNPDTWYCGTGEAFYVEPANVRGNTLGNGIFKSTDNGSSWSKLTSTESNPSLFDSPFDLVHRLAIHPVTGDIYAAVHRRIMRSKDGGQNWETVLASDSTASATEGLTEVIIPSNGSKIFAAISGGNRDKNLAGVWESASGDASTWKRIAGGAAGQPDHVAGWRAYGNWDRIVLALNSANTRLFVLYKNNQSSSGPDPKPEADLFRCNISSGNPSTYTWTNLNAYVPDEPNFNEPNLDPYSTYFNGFAMSLAVKPDNDNILFIGGSMIHRVDLTQTDPAKKFTRIGGYGRGFFPNEDNEYPNHHPDIHGIYFVPGNNDRLFTADDGGIHKTTTSVMADTVRWQPMVTGLQTVQYQTISISPESGDNTVTGGTQDNGTLANNDPFNSTTHSNILFGDGASSAVSNFTKTGNSWKQNYFASIVNGTIYRFGLTFQYDPNANKLTFKSNTFDNITPSNLEGQGQWLTLLVNDPDSSEHLYYNSHNRLYRTTKASAVTPTGWTQITGVGTTVPSNEDFTFMAISKKVNGNKYLFVGTDNGHLYRLNNPNTAAPNTVPINITPTAMIEGTSTNDGSYVAGIAVNPRNPDTVMAVVSNYDASGNVVPNIFWTGNATAATPTWQVIDGELEPVSSQSCAIVVTPSGVEYYVGTSVGLYSTTAINGNNTQWLKEGSGMMKTAIIRALAVRPQDNTMVIGTHGNGAFITKINSTGVPDSTGNGNFITAVYPTLTNNTVQYKIGNMVNIKNIMVRLFNMQGQLLYKEQRGYQNGEVDVSQFPGGVYILVIDSDDGKNRHVQKIVKQ